MTDREKIIEAMARAVRATRVPMITPETEGTDYDRRIAAAALAAIEAMGAVVVPVEGLRTIIRDAFVDGCHATRNKSALFAGEYADRKVAASPYRRPEDGQ